MHNESAPSSPDNSNPLERPSVPHPSRLETAPDPGALHESSSLEAPHPIRNLGEGALHALHFSEALPDVNVEALGELLTPTQERRLEQRLEQYAELMPAFADAVVQPSQHETPPQAPILPTGESVRKAKPLLNFLYKIFNVFGLGARFDALLSKKALDITTTYASELNAFLNAMAHMTQSPKAQLVDELSAMHAELRRGGENARAVRNQLQDLVRGQLPAGKEFPLTNSALRLTTRQQSDSKHFQRAAQIRVATPEIIQGVEQFLAAQGVEVTPVNAPDETLTRRLAKQFAGKRLEQTPTIVAARLESVFNVLPDDGQQFANNVRQLCRNVVTAARSQQSAPQIVNAFLADLRRKVNH